MAIEWHLKELLAQIGIYNSRQLSEALEKKVLVSISPQGLHSLMNQKPRQIRLTTAQALCNLLNRPLNDILIVKPEPIIYPTDRIIKPYGPKKLDSPIVDPSDYL